MLKLVDLLMRAGLDDDRLTRALTEQVAPQLADPQAGPALARRFAHRLGAEPAWPRPPRPCGSGYRNGETRSGPGVEWFVEGSGMRHRQSCWAPNLGTRRGPAPRCAASGPSGPTEDRFARLWWLAASGSTRHDDLAAEHIWDPAELLAAGGAAFSSAALVPTLVGAPDSDELARLADEVLTANTDELAVACAVLRTVDPVTWVQHGYIDSHQRTYAPLWDIALAEIPAAEVYPGVAIRLAAVAAVAVVAGQPRPIRAGSWLPIPLWLPRPPTSCWLWWSIR